MSSTPTYSTVDGVTLRTYKVSLFQRTLEKAWFFQFFIGILLCVNNGACFCFGIFSPFMKRQGFHYSQSQVNIVSTVGVLLSYFSMPTGFLYDLKGPRATLLVGTTLNVTGWAGMYLIFKDMDHPLLSNSVVVMSFFYGLSQLSASFYETGTVLTSLQSFSCYQGRVILIQKTFMGLGSSIVAQLYVAFVEKNFDGIAIFFVFLMLYSAMVGVLSVEFIRLPTPRTRCVGLNVEDAETVARGGGEPRMFQRPFNVGTVILCIGVLFVATTSMVEVFVTLTDWGRFFIGTFTVALCVSFTLIIFTTPNYEVNADGRRSSRNGEVTVTTEELGGAATAEDEFSTQQILIEDDRLRSHDEDLKACSALPNVVNNTAPAFTPLTDAPSDGDQRDYGATLQKGPLTRDDILQADYASPNARLPQSGDDDVKNSDSLWNNLRHADLWLLWVACFASWSAMTLVSTNSSQIYQAISFDSFSLTVNTVFVSIYGVASAMGRVLVGILHPWLQRHHLPIVAVLPMAPLLNIVGLPLFLIVPASLLFIPFSIVGLAVGISWGSTVLIITSFFTKDNCGKHYSFLYTAGMLSPLVFNMMLFGPFYDHYSRVQGRESDKSCKGSVCIAASFLVCTVLNLLAAPLAYLLYRRTSKRGGIVYTEIVIA